MKIRTSPYLQNMDKYKTSLSRRLSGFGETRWWWTVLLSIVLLWGTLQGFAVSAPNGQYDQCGPYYLWYQIGPDSLRYTGDYVDLCEITFDVSDVGDDFDFVYFTGERAIFDQNRDGISDRYFQFPPTPTPKASQFGRPNTSPLVTEINPNILKWKPDRECVRINLRDCWRDAFNPMCGPAMISIQPKPGYREGRARIPIHVNKRCPPYGDDCSETTTIFHEYTDCHVPSQPDFMVNKQADKFLLPESTSTYYSYSSPLPGFLFTLTVHNIGGKRGDTVLTDTFTDGSIGGNLVLSELKITCPSIAQCAVVSLTERQLKIELLGLRVNEMATITYKLTGNPQEIPIEEISYFMNTAILSNGNSAQVTVGIRGGGGFPKRPERPRPQE